MDFVKIIKNYKGYPSKKIIKDTHCKNSLKNVKGTHELTKNIIIKIK